MVAKKEASMIEADYVTKSARGQDEVGELTKQLFLRVASAAAGSKE